MTNLCVVMLMEKVSFAVAMVLVEMDQMVVVVVASFAVELEVVD